MLLNFDYLIKIVAVPSIYLHFYEEFVKIILENCFLVETIVKEFYDYIQVLQHCYSF